MKLQHTSSFRRISMKRTTTFEDQNSKPPEVQPEPKPVTKTTTYKILVNEDSLKKEISISNPPDRDIVLQILSKPAQRRQEIEIRFMKNAFREIRFFAEREQDLTEKFLKEMYRKLKLEQFEASGRVFKTGDTGTKFYIILKGSVYVLLDKEGITEEPFHKRRKSITFEELKKAADESYGIKKFLNDNPHAPEEVIRAKFEKAYPDMWIARSMHEGDSFGEIALFDEGDGKRTATIVCREDTMFGILNREDFQSILSKLYERKKIDLVNYFRKIDIFADWTYSDVMALLPHFERQVYQRNYIIYRQNEQPHYLYFIYKGQIELKKIEMVKKNEDSQGAVQSIETIVQDKPKSKKLKTTQVKQEIRIGLINEGEYFGEVEVINEKLRKYTAVVASTEAEFLLITKDKFHRLIRDKRSLLTLNTHIESKEKWHSKMTKNYELIHNINHEEGINPRVYAKVKETMNGVANNLDYNTEQNFFKAFQGLSPARHSLANLEPPRVENVKLITFTEKVHSPLAKLDSKLKNPMQLRLSNLQKKLAEMDRALGLSSSNRNSESQRWITKQEIDREEKAAETMFNFVVKPKVSMSKLPLLTIETQKLAKTEYKWDSPDKIYFPLSSRIEPSESQFLDPKSPKEDSKKKLRNLKTLKTKLDRILLDGIKNEESTYSTFREQTTKYFYTSKYSNTKSFKNSMNESSLKPVQISKWSINSKNWS